MSEKSNNPHVSGNDDTGRGGSNAARVPNNVSPPKPQRDDYADMMQATLKSFKADATNAPKPKEDLPRAPSFKVTPDFLDAMRDKPKT